MSAPNATLIIGADTYYRKDVSIYQAQLANTTDLFGNTYNGYTFNLFDQGLSPGPIYDPDILTDINDVRILSNITNVSSQSHIDLLFSNGTVNLIVQTYATHQFPVSQIGVDPIEFFVRENTSIDNSDAPESFTPEQIISLLTGSSEFYVYTNGQNTSPTFEPANISLINNEANLTINLTNTVITTQVQNISVFGNVSIFDSPITNTYAVQTQEFRDSYITNPYLNDILIYFNSGLEEGDESNLIIQFSNTYTFNTIGLSVDIANVVNTTPYTARFTDIVDLDNSTTYVKINNNATATTNISMSYMMFTHILENPLDPEANKNPFPLSQLGGTSTFTLQGDLSERPDTLENELVFDFQSYFLSNLKIKSSQLVSFDKDLFGLKSSGFLLQVQDRYTNTTVNTISELQSYNIDGLSNISNVSTRYTRFLLSNGTAEMGYATETMQIITNSTGLFLYSYANNSIIDINNLSASFTPEEINTRINTGDQYLYAANTMTTVDQDRINLLTADTNLTFNFDSITIDTTGKAVSSVPIAGNVMVFDGGSADTILNIQSTEFSDNITQFSGQAQNYDIAFYFDTTTTSTANLQLSNTSSFNTIGYSIQLDTIDNTTPYFVRYSKVVDLTNDVIHTRTDRHLTDNETISIQYMLFDNAADDAGVNSSGSFNPKSLLSGPNTLGLVKGILGTITVDSVDYNIANLRVNNTQLTTLTDLYGNEKEGFLMQLESRINNVSVSSLTDLNTNGLELISNITNVDSQIQSVIFSNTTNHLGIPGHELQFYENSTGVFIFSQPNTSIQGINDTYSISQITSFLNSGDYLIYAADSTPLVPPSTKTILESEANLTIDFNSITVNTTSKTVSEVNVSGNVMVLYGQDPNLTVESYNVSSSLFIANVSTYPYLHDVLMYIDSDNFSSNASIQFSNTSSFTSIPLSIQLDTIDNATPYQVRYRELVDLSTQKTYVRTSSYLENTTNLSIRYMMFDSAIGVPGNATSNSKPYPLSTLQTATLTLLEGTYALNLPATLDGTFSRTVATVNSISYGNVTDLFGLTREGYSIYFDNATTISNLSSIGLEGRSNLTSLQSKFTHFQLNNGLSIFKKINKCGQIIQDNSSVFLFLENSTALINPDNTTLNPSQIVSEINSAVDPFYLYTNSTSTYYEDENWQSNVSISDFRINGNLIDTYVSVNKPIPQDFAGSLLTNDPNEGDTYNFEVETGDDGLLRVVFNDRELFDSRGITFTASSTEVTLEPYDVASLVLRNLGRQLVIDEILAGKHDCVFFFNDTFPDSPNVRIQFSNSATFDTIGLDLELDNLVANQPYFVPLNNIYNTTTGVSYSRVTNTITLVRFLELSGRLSVWDNVENNDGPRHTAPEISFNIPVLGNNYNLAAFISQLSQTPAITNLSTAYVDTIPMMRQFRNNLLESLSIWKGNRLDIPSLNITSTNPMLRMKQVGDTIQPM